MLETLSDDDYVNVVYVSTPLAWLALMWAQLPLFLHAVGRLSW